MVIYGPEIRGPSQDLIKKAKFTLSFENSAETDYVTEMCFLPIIHGSVPVVYGAPNVNEFAPGRGSVIDAAEYLDKYVWCCGWRGSTGIGLAASVAALQQIY